jgi:hypothetical protein
MSEYCRPDRMIEFRVAFEDGIARLVKILGKGI